MPDSAAKISKSAVLVTGMSGAGKSSCLKALEDMGFEAVDNLPLGFLPRLAPQTGEGGAGRPLAIGVDIRTRDFAPEALLAEAARISEQTGAPAALLFLDCGDAALSARFAATRRRHPLALDRPVSDGITRERELMRPLRDAANTVIDTTDKTPADLKRALDVHFGAEAGRGLTLFVTSFSFARGLPREADLVFDVRFLQNPHYDDALRDLTGRDEAVGAYIEKDPAFAPFFENLTALLAPLIPRYAAEGKSYLTIALGCTGGRHRSVFAAERLAARLEADGAGGGAAHAGVRLHHRDLPKQG